MAKKIKAKGMVRKRSSGFWLGDLATVDKELKIVISCPNAKRMKDAMGACNEVARKAGFEVIGWEKV